MKEYSVQSQDFGKAIIKTPDGNLVLGGTTISPSGDSSLCMIKTDPSGDIIWSKIFSLTNGADLRSMVATRDSGIAILAYSANTNSGILIKTDSLGDPIWQKEYVGLHPLAFIQCKENGYCISGQTGAGWSGESQIIKTDAYGYTLWTHCRVDWIYEYSCPYLIQIEDSSFIIAEVFQQLDVGVPGLLRLSKDGAFISKMVGMWGPEEYYDLVFCRTSDSTYFLSGHNYKSLVYGSCFMKYNSPLSIAWVKNMTADAEPTFCIKQSSDGSILMLQESQLIKTDTAGNFIWGGRVNGMEVYGKNSLVELPDGSPAICATIAGKIVYVRMDSTGYNCLSNTFNPGIVSVMSSQNIDTGDYQFPGILGVSAPSLIVNTSAVTPQTVCLQYTGTSDLECTRVHLSPNPAAGMLVVHVECPEFLRGKNSVLAMTIYDMAGQIVSSRIPDADGNLLSIPVGHLGPGIYFVSIDFIQPGLKLRFIKM